MARKKSPHLTDAELRLMEVVWKKGSATVSEVVADLPKHVSLAYSTVITTLRILENKGYLRHTKDGRAFVYRAVIDHGEASESAVSQLVRRFFQGSPERLMLSLLKSKTINSKELKRLRRMVGEDPEGEES